MKKSKNGYILLHLVFDKVLFLLHIPNTWAEGTLNKTKKLTRIRFKEFDPFGLCFTILFIAALTVIHYYDIKDKRKRWMINRCS